ncbi:hypothetical protein MIND_01067900 [Mycena indigotica]|uniref:CxC5 like cysteine cluster associated with KDZ domain-containing protein n=1 Tax=Mycena indigotica TaxID=2126181 RepID=A0A8H6SBI5_9AGAR|nr:uncharacterized protein MIND_01067900 [Mycena indigotica]KAF7295287.1 hypothetical protein MIND_01067900 [Mycena indigotica]
MLPPTVSIFLTFLQFYLPKEFSLQRALYITSALITAYPLFRLHQNQRREPYQKQRTAWLTSLKEIIREACGSHHEHPDFPPEHPDVSVEVASKLSGEIDSLYRILGIDDTTSMNFPEPPILLCTVRLHCVFCADNFHPRTLRRYKKPMTVRVLDRDFNWKTATLFVAYCIKCESEYYPDRITYRPPGTSFQRKQRLESDANYLRVSKHGVWIHRRIAVAQEKALLRFHVGWSTFSEWLNDIVPTKTAITARQSQRLYQEHFSRRLLSAHDLIEEFAVPAHSTANVLSESVRDAIGKNGGVVAGAMDHGCLDCTHLKRYHSDLNDIELGVLSGDEEAIVGIEPQHSQVHSDTEPLMEGPHSPAPEVATIPSGLARFPAQQQRIPGSKRGYVRMAVMDGKTITHRICAVKECENPLTNYRNGRFCKHHLDRSDLCGIASCGLHVSEPGALTCASATHKMWYQKYLTRFRLSFTGVRRIIRRQENQANTSNNHSGPGDTRIRPDLPELDGILGMDVEHTFRARTTYCLQTVQWACGCPVGWGKVFVGETPSRVWRILDAIWADYPDHRPSFLAYDDACSLLRHIVTQDRNNLWITGTKLIVDAWHYINHQATDLLCRVWCNPAPSNSSQPDLITVQTDEQGHPHLTRAFNTETAEQLNAWLNGFEAQLRQMSDVNYDFCVHVLMMLYKEEVERKVSKRSRELDEIFWASVNSTE